MSRSPAHPWVVRTPTGERLARSSPRDPPTSRPLPGDDPGAARTSRTCGSDPVIARHPEGCIRRLKGKDRKARPRKSCGGHRPLSTPSLAVRRLRSSSRLETVEGFWVSCCRQGSLGARLFSRAVREGPMSHKREGPLSDGRLRTRGPKGSRPRVGAPPRRRGVEARAASRRSEAAPRGTGRRGGSPARGGGRESPWGE